MGLIFLTLSPPFSGELAYRIESRLADCGYKAILCKSGDHPEPEDGVAVDTCLNIIRPANMFRTS